MRREHFDVEIYPDQERQAAAVLAKLDDQFAFSNGKYDEDGSDRRLFEAAAKSEFAKIGLAINVRWAEQLNIEMKPSGLFTPQLEIVGQLRESETDHDRIKWGVVKGLADGQPGYVREDGTRHEEPIKKLII